MNEIAEALDRARRHFGKAAEEGLLAVRAVVEATLYTAFDGPPAPGTRAAEGLRALDDWLDTVRKGEGLELPAAWTGALSRALDEEIGRWEALSRDDPSVRPVLRAFLGLREMLWEMGWRPAPESSDPGEAPLPPMPAPGDPLEPWESTHGGQPDFGFAATADAGGTTSDTAAMPRATESERADSAGSESARGRVQRFEVED